jgi:transcriptional regulator with XRE-family HTH domain
MMNRFRHSPAHELLRALLVAKRTSHGLTQKNLAEILKKPQSYVSKYETGEKNLDIVEFINISNALNENPEKFFSEYLNKLIN